jgi:hypothetical protein
VRGEAVGFHYELGLGPGEVDLVALDPAVDLRLRKTVAVDEGEEAPLAMAEGVDAAVERPKGPGPKPFLDPGGPYAGAENLRATANAVLASGNGRLPPIRRGVRPPPTTLGP